MDEETKDYMRQHLSFKCRLWYDTDHEPCSGTCDEHHPDGSPRQPCVCWCHQEEDDSEPSNPDKVPDAFDNIEGFGMVEYFYG